jgi:hypothetical protein
MRNPSPRAAEGRRALRVTGPARALRGLALSTLALAVALACCPPAWAGFKSPECEAGGASSSCPAFALASVQGHTGEEQLLQADYAYDPAISGNGRYVAFTGSVASRPGVYRKDLLTGELQLVAPGQASGAPSISDNGQYISFTTSDDLATGEPAGGESCGNVYVRDMSRSVQETVREVVGRQVIEYAAQPGAYELASAASESESVLQYEPSTSPGRPCGAASANRVALSGNGEEVAFTILSSSDLTGPCVSAPQLHCPTPAGQVAVRDLHTKTTTLVSVTSASLGGKPEPVPSGAALMSTSAVGTVRLNGASVILPDSASTAAISADGSTVAWMGIDVPAQAPVSGGVPDPSVPDGYAEPLWRQISSGPATPTLRVLAGQDTSAPGCPPACAGGLDLGWDTQELNEYTGLAPAFGSYIAAATNSEGFSGGGFGGPLEAVTPQLSENGGKVAILSTQPDYGDDPDFGLLSQTQVPTANAFVVNMAPGLTRAQAITRLTAWASLNFKNNALAGSVTSIALSPDGSRVAFTTARTTFPLSPPALVTPPLSQVSQGQLYEANLQAGTLALVSFGFDGQPARSNVYAAALSDDGQRIALSSGAENLAYGAVNTGSDVFVTEEIDPPLLAGQQSLTEPPSGPALAPQWRLSATVSPAPGGGALLLDVSVPGAGALYASAEAAVPVATARGSRLRKAGRSRKTSRAPRANDSRKSNRSRKGVAGTAKIAARQVAHASLGTSGAQVVQLRLTPASRYRSLLSDKGGLYATITLTFTASGHPRLTRTLQASFPHPYPLYKLPLYKLPKHKHKHPAGGSAKPHGKRGGRR